MAAREKVTLEAFKQYVEEPENADRLFELINGESVEKRLVPTSISQIHSILTAEVRSFCKTTRLPCYTTSVNGAFDVLGQILAPDFAYKQTPVSSDYPDPVPPLWVSIVISEAIKIYPLHAKRTIYLKAGILYWEIYPEDQLVDVFSPDKPLRTYRVDDMLDVSDLLPGFKLAVRELFEQ